MAKDINEKDNKSKLNKFKLNNFINGQYDNVMVLAGAGSSISHNKKDTGLTMYQLADNVNNKINERYLKHISDDSIDHYDYYNLFFMAEISNFYEINKSKFKKYVNKIKPNDSKLLDQEHKVKKSYKNIYKYYKDTNGSLSVKNIALHLMYAFSNFESLLSNVNDFKNYVNLSYGDSEVNRYSRSIKRIHFIIRNDCTLTYESKYFKHVPFIKELQVLSPADKRLKIYSTNYDTLFDQAAAKCGLFIIDGFNYGINRQFSSNALDIDFVNRNNDSKVMTTSNTSLCKNVIKIFQLHGSVSWYKYKNKSDTSNNGIYKTNSDIAKRKIYGEDNDHKYCKSCMIFPSRNKYEQSYEDPFFDLFFNFQRDLHKNNTLLIVVGFSFGDMHIKRMVYDAMVSNTSLSMIFISHSGDATRGDVADFFNKTNSTDLFGSREIIYKGTLSSFTEDLDLKAIYKNH